MLIVIFNKKNHHASPTEIGHRSSKRHPPDSASTRDADPFIDRIASATTTSPIPWGPPTFFVVVPGANGDPSAGDSPGPLSTTVTQTSRSVLPQLTTT